MPFDTRYYGGGALAAPSDYHPDAPATGHALNHALRSSYAYARTHARLVGIQTTFTQWDQARLLNSLNSDFFYEASWVDIAQFDLANLEEHRTHLFCEAHYLLLAEHPAIAHLRLRVTDTSGETDETGDDCPSYYSPFATQEIDPTGTPGYLQFGLSGMTRGHGRCSMNAESFQGQRIIITVQAYAESEDLSTGLGYHPEQIVCWMDSVD